MPPTYLFTYYDNTKGYLAEKIAEVLAHGIVAADVKYEMVTGKKFDTKNPFLCFTMQKL